MPGLMVPGRPRRSRRRPEAPTLLLLGAAALGAALVLARGIRYGVGLSYDSIGYLAVARHLVDGNGFLTFDWGPYAHGPPFYPLVLAAAGLGVFDPFEIAGALNAAVFGLTVFVAGNFLRRRVASRFLVAWGAFTLAVSLPLVGLASWALTGSLFVLLSTLALVNTEDFLTGGRRRALVGAIVCSALAWQTRYLGAAVVGAVGLLLLTSRGSWGERGKRVAALSLAAGLPMAGWILRNTVLVGHAFGRRELQEDATPTSLAGAFAETLGVLRGWLDLDLFGGGGVLIPVAVLAVPLAAAVAIHARRVPGPRRGGAEAGLPDPVARANRQGLRTFLTFAFVYLALLVVALGAGLTAHGVEPRFVAPLYVPLLLAAALALDRLFLRERQGRERQGRERRGRRGKGPGGPEAEAGEARPARAPRRLALATVAALAAWTVGQAALHAPAVRAANSADPSLDRGFAAPPWADSETIRTLRDREIYGALFTNLPILLYLHFDHTRFTRYLPVELSVGGRFRPGDPGSGEVSKPFREWIGEAPDGTWVVWFHRGVAAGGYEYGLAELRSQPTLEPMADLEDGAIFRVNRSYEPPANPYEAAYRAMQVGAGGREVARSAFTLYFDGERVGYLREPCTEADAEPRFFLHLYPVDTADLPPHRTLYGFENRDFEFRDYGVILDAAPEAPPDSSDPTDPAVAPSPTPGAKCVALAPVPEYPIDHIRTGQYLSGQPALWTARFEVADPDPE